MSASPHLDPGTLYELQSGELDTAAGERAKEHLEGCGRCQAEAAMLRDFQDGDARPLDDLSRRRLWQSVQPHGSRPRLRSPWIVRGLLAASVVAAALGVRELLPDPTATGPTGELRSTREEFDWNLRATTTTDGWTVRWEPFPGATSYRLRIRSAQGELIFERDVVSAPATILASELGEVSGSADLLLLELRAIGAVDESPALLTLPH